MDIRSMIGTLFLNGIVIIPLLLAFFAGEPWVGYANNLIIIPMLLMMVIAASMSYMVLSGNFSRILIPKIEHDSTSYMWLVSRTAVVFASAALGWWATAFAFAVVTYYLAAYDFIGEKEKLRLIDEGKINLSGENI